MKKMIKWFISIFALLIILVLVGIYIYGPNFNFYLFPPTAEKYGEQALNKMDQFGLYSNSKEWELVRNDIHSQLKKINNYEEAIPLLEKAIKTAGGKHSFITNVNERDGSSSDQFVLPSFQVTEDILTLTVPAFSGNNEQAKAYANTLADALNKLNYKGVILDLRNNTGGDMGPMISGLSPLLSDGELLYFVDKNENKTPVTLENGTISTGGNGVSIKNSHKITKLPIAILINELTGSSGEITALCFKGIPNVQFLGTESAGYTSANMPVTLYDGSIMQLTYAAIEDANRSIYDNTPIIPDIKTNNAISDAKKWLSDNNNF